MFPVHNCHSGVECKQKRARPDNDGSPPVPSKRRQQLLTSVFTVVPKTPKAARGKICVAKYFPGKPLPKTPGFYNVFIHTTNSNLGGELSPFVLKDEKGHLLENVWQFSKVYAYVNAQCIKLSRFHPRVIIWEHPKEVHVDDGKVLPAYWKWREKGMNNHYAVRYPNGYHGRHQCLYSLWPRNDGSGEFEKLSYIEARKKIYCGEYVRFAPQTAHFRKLQAMLAGGTNLQIIEVDGPDFRLNFPPYDQLSEQNPGLLITAGIIKMLVNDSRKPFGHGYVVAALLLNGAEWLKE